MDLYRHFEVPTGVVAFEARENSIIVQFNDGSKYLYDEVRPGREHVEAMIERARAGVGLATYLNKFVRESYAQKL